MVGKVVAVDAVASRVTVLVNDGEVYLPACAGPYEVDDLVWIARGGKGFWWVIGVVGVAPPPPP